MAVPTMCCDCSGSAHSAFRYTGMLEAVRVRREGYAYRPFFSDFFQSYRTLAFNFTEKVALDP